MKDCIVCGALTTSSENEEIVFCEECNIEPDAGSLKYDIALTDIASTEDLSEKAHMAIAMEPDTSSLKYDIVLTDIASTEDLSEKAHMAIAYVLFEDKIKSLYGDTDPGPDVEEQVQDESAIKAYEMAENLPAVLRESVNEEEALFLKERLAKYGVAVSLEHGHSSGHVDSQTFSTSQPKISTPEQTEKSEETGNSEETATMAVMIAIAVTIMVSAGGVFAYFYFDGNGTDDYIYEPKSIVEAGLIFDIDMSEVGNTSGNTANGGLAAIQGDWIYFFGGNGLYRKMVDGSNEQKLTDGDISYINVIGDWVYFTNTVWDDTGHVYRIEADGSNRQKILSVYGRISRLQIIGDWVYFLVTYFDSYYSPSAYRMRSDGSDKQLLFDSFYEIHINIVFSENWIYWNENRDGLYRVNIYDTDIIQKIVDTSGQVIGMIDVVDGWLYYAGYDFDSEEWFFYRMEIDGSERQIISNEPLSNFNVTEDWIFFNYGGGISKIRADVTDIQNMHIVDGTDMQNMHIYGWASDFSVVGDWIFFTFADFVAEQTRLYRIDTELNNRELIYIIDSWGFDDYEFYTDPGHVFQQLI